MSHADIIQKNYDALLRCTTINYYVIDCLRTEDVLDRAQEAKLKGKRNTLTQRILLFQWLKELPYEKYESFLQVMNETEQEHVTNLLRGKTEEGHLPLLKAKHDRIEKNRPKIAHVLFTDSELIAELLISKAISKMDAEEIRAEKVEYVKSSKLISAIMRRSNQCYTSFQEGLRKTLQAAAAEFLNEGEMPAVHINNNRPDLDESLSFAFNETIRNNSENDARIQEVITEMNGYGLTPVKANPGQSIVIFIYCKTVQNAVKFTQLFNSGILQYLLDRILSRLLLTIEPQNTKELNSFIHLEDDEIGALEEFTGIDGWKVQSHNRIKLFGKESGRNATTQTDDDLLKTNATVELPVKCRSDPVLVRTIRIKAAEEQYKVIRGLTILDNELFVVTGWSPEVEVYDSRKLCFSRRWNLNELVNPQDIGSCSRNKCLYIIDSKFDGQSNEILRVDPNGMLILIWSTGDGYEWGLSVTDESNVILVVYDKHKLREYSSDGQLIREINLSTEAGIIYPWHSIKLINGHFAVSHGSGNNEQHKVSIVDANGKLQKSFGRTRRSTIMQMSCPVYLSVDGNGFVMVADQDNGRILLLDPDLEFRKELLCKEKHGLRFPQRILLDESNGRLFVADNDGRGGQILVFSLTNKVQQ